MNKFLTFFLMIHTLNALCQSEFSTKLDRLQEACENATELFNIWHTMQEFEITKYKEMATNYKLPEVSQLIKNKMATLTKHQEGIKLCLLHPDTFPSDGLIRRNLHNSTIQMRPQLLEEYGDPYEINDRIKIIQDAYYESMGIPIPEEEPCCYV